MQDGPFASVFELEEFERFVYVLSVLDNYTDPECADLLESSLQEVEKARHRALQHLADACSEVPTDQT